MKKYAACIIPACPVRKKPSHKVEMTNQLLFGECVEVKKEKKEWWKIKSLHDNYVGWIRSNQLTEISEEEALKKNEYVTTALINPIVIGSSTMNVPIGSSLPEFSDNRGMVGKMEFQFNGHTCNKKKGPSDIQQLVMPWLHAPYLWGGRTPFGVDCSGFVQVVMKLAGIQMLRDARLQVDQGKEVATLSEAQTGDLAFFNDREEIVHVGILLSNNSIIHAAGKVRIDTIDEKGITNGDTGKRTHQLKTIRRIF